MRVDGNHHHHISRSYAMLVMNRVTSLDLAQSSQLSLSLSLSLNTSSPRVAAATRADQHIRSVSEARMDELRRMCTSPHIHTHHRALVHKALVVGIVQPRFS